MDDGYKCNFCHQSLLTLKGYVNHSRFHRNECNRSFPCPHSNCQRRLTSYRGLISHLQRDHSKPTVHHHYRNINLPLQCAAVFCNQVCEDIKTFLKHLKEHLDTGNAVVACPFNNCDSSFSKKSSFTSHLSRYHKSDMAGHVPTDVVNVNYQENVEEQSFSLFDEESLDEVEVLKETNFVGDLYIKNLLLFYLQLQLFSIS